LNNNASLWYASGMTVEELKSGIEQSTPEQRLYLAALLKHLNRRDDPAYQAELARLSQEIDDGRKFFLDQAKRLHETLEADGL
jgi:hypothetical protein